MDGKLPRGRAVMKRSVLIFGLILGTILTVHMLYAVNLVYHKPAFESNDFIGYVFLIGACSLTFFGIRYYRNKQLDGVITLGKAFKTGALIAFLGATMYVVVWLFYYYLFIPDFLDKYIEHVIIEANRDGATATELAETTEWMEFFRKLYKYPIMVILISYMEVLFIGLPVAFVSALILKKEDNAE